MLDVVAVAAQQDRQGVGRDFPLVLEMADTEDDVGAVKDVLLAEDEQALIRKVLAEDRVAIPVSPMFTTTGSLALTRENVAQLRNITEWDLAQESKRKN
jgi:hypothetical protein